MVDAHSTHGPPTGAKKCPPAASAVGYYTNRNCHGKGVPRIERRWGPQPSCSCAIPLPPLVNPSAWSIIAEFADLPTTPKAH